MNLLQNIEIKNFKSIRHQKIEDCRRVNVFIGYPNVGKSNILEALGLFSIYKPTINTYDVSFLDFVRIENLTTFFYNGDIIEPCIISINDDYRFTGEYSKDRLKCYLEYDREKYGFTNIDIDKHSFLVDRKESLIVNNYEVLDSDKKVINYSGNQDLKLSKNINTLILKYEYKKNINYSSEYHWSLKYPFGENIFDIISRNNELRKSVIEFFTDYRLNFSFDKSSQSFKILKFVGNDIFLIPYSMIADTLQRLIFHKAAIASNKNAVLLFEEPEAHMFPPYISKFTSDVIYDENNNQYFIATHSPIVVNDFMENLEKDAYSIYTVGYDNETGETLIRRMTDEDLHEIYQFGVDLFLNLENYLPHAQQQ